MTLSTAWRLARPRSAADRGRFLLIACATAIAGALLLAAAHVLRLPAGPGEQTDGLASYVAESGLRGGVVIAVLLLTVPVLALALQALRVGSVARDRRMASLRLAGATPRDARVIAAAEAGAAAAAGGVLAGAGYVALWLALGVLPPSGSRMLATPDVLDLPAWAALVVLCASAGALAGAAVQRRAIVEPLGVRRRRAPRLPGRANLAALGAGVVLVLCGLLLIPRLGSDGGDAAVALAIALAGLLLAAFAGGPRLVLGCARVLARRRGAAALLAQRRLRADPRSPGRVAAVLVVCGIALGIEALLAVQAIGLDNGTDPAFYLAGYGMAAAVVLVAAAVALLTLLVGAADALLDARQPLATLAALGVDERLLVRVVARQLSATAVPAIVLGVFVGGPAIAVLGAVGAGDGGFGFVMQAIVPTLLAALVAGLALAAVARLAARLLRSLIRAAIDPENLRVA